MSELETLLKEAQLMTEDERKKRLALLITQYKNDQIFNKVKYFKPNKAQRELVRLTKDYKEILASWGNRMGKTWIAGYIFYVWATGDYPDWWDGHRYNRPIRCLIMGKTRPAIRDSSQRILIDEYKTGIPGTGIIPKKVLEKCTIKYLRDENDAIDYIMIPHKSGANSTFVFTTQNTPWVNLMGSEFDVCWADEQVDGNGVPPRHYSQFLRATASMMDSRIILTATPELGRTQIFDYFEQDTKGNKIIQYASLWDADHYTQEQMEVIYNSYPESELEFRVYGKPRIGSGLIYTINEHIMKCEPFMIPEGWKRLSAVDFGRSQSKNVILWLAQDPVNQILYVYDGYWSRNQDPKDIYVQIEKRDRDAGFKIPMAWPRDGNIGERSSGNQVAKIYATLGVRMINEAANTLTQDGKKSFEIEGGVITIQSMIDSGLLRIFDVPQLSDIWEEFRRYSRDENGQIPKKRTNNVDFLDALRYGVIMFDRYAAKKPNYISQKLPKVFKLQKSIFHRSV